MNYNHRVDVWYSHALGHWRWDIWGWAYGQRMLRVDGGMSISQEGALLQGCDRLKRLS